MPRKGEVRRREVLPDPVDVVLEGLLLVARQPIRLEAGVAAADVEQRVDARLDVARVDRRLRVEIEVEARRAALGGAEACKLAQHVHAACHHPVHHSQRRRF